MRIQTAAYVPVAPIGAHQLLVFLLQLGSLLLLAFLLGRLAMRFGMPAVAGELCAGVLAGPSLLAHVAPSAYNWLLPRDSSQYHMLDAVGEVGLVLLVAITGIHMDLGLVRKRGAAAARIGIAGLAIPLGIGIGTGLLIPGSLIPGSAHRDTFALFLGVAMGVSALPVIARILLDLRMLHRDMGQLILCAVTVADTIGWVLLSIVSAMTTTGARGGDIGLSFGYLAIVIIVAIAGRPFVRAGLRAAAKSPQGGSTIALVVILALLGAAATQAMNLEAAFGAFVIGIVINSCGTLDAARLAPLRATVLTILAPIFFAIAGLRMNLTALGQPVVLLTGLIVLCLAIAGKFAGAYIGARLGKLGHWEGVAVGAGLNARGVIEVIIAIVGLQLGVLTSGMYTIIVLVAVATSVMAPPLLRFAMTRVEHTAEEQLRESVYDSVYGVDQVRAGNSAARART
ncbi:MAG TPA: cation:proton antiporter [Streptosporangiaceae bacterium]